MLVEVNQEEDDELAPTLGGSVAVCSRGATLGGSVALPFCKQQDDEKSLG